MDAPTVQSDYRGDREYARSLEPTFDHWYPELDFCAEFTRVPDNTRLQMEGVDVIIKTTDGREIKIDEKVSKDAVRTGNMLYEVWQCTHEQKEGWGMTSTADVICYGVDDPLRSRIRVYWVKLPELREWLSDHQESCPYRDFRPFEYKEGYLRYSAGHLIPLDRLRQEGIAIGPLDVRYRGVSEPTRLRRIAEIYGKDRAKR